MKMGAFVVAVLTFTLFALLAASVFAADEEEEETQQQLEIRCMAEGGCATLTRRQYMQSLREAAEFGRQKGLEEGRKLCMKGRA